MNEPQAIYLADHVLLGRYLSAFTGALCVPLTYLLGYWNNPYELQARRAAAQTRAPDAP